MNKLWERSAATDEHGPVLLSPAPLTHEEWLAEIEESNKNAVEPGTAINLDAEEFIKAARGEPTIYGQARLAHFKKYRDEQ